MKQKYPLLIVIGLLLFCFGETFAQCGVAQSLTVGNGTCNSIFYNNSTANTTGNPPTPPCWSPNSMSHTMWFSFVAPIADIEISSNFSGTLANTQLAVYSGTCGALTLIGCQEDVNTATGLLHTNIILHGLTPGSTYYIAVDGNGNTTGTFGICVQRSTPVGPAQPFQDCVSSQSLCGISNIVVPDGPGGVGLSQEWPSCFGTPGERSSNWYSFTAATNGNLCFTLTPNSAMDYDFAVYNTSSSCPGTEVVCNWEPEDGDGTTGLGCNPGDPQCDTCIAVVAGQTYSILIDRYTAASTSGFTLNFAGTTTTFASPNPTFTNTTVCVGSPTAFTNTTNGNYTYSWTFGDGGTSSLENPTHTYASAGTYNVTLLVTAVPGGCQNAITRSVTVSAPPTVDAGAGTTICPGASVNLAGSTNGTGSIGPVSFSNNSAFAIPDGNLTGISSPITVSGIVPATISATSIASVCLDIAHGWDSDLDIFLRCPDGTQIELSTDNGTTNDNYTNTCFSPTATTAITAGAPPFTGNFLPEQPFTNLNGCNANGTWNLIVVDDLGGIVGTLTGWTITFNNNIPPFTWSPTAGMTNANTLTPTVSPTVTTTYTLTANAAGGCSTTDTVTITVGGGPTATITYPAAAFCTTDTPKNVTLTGTGAYTGGSFTSTTGLTINATTGAITPASSTPGPYTVTYNIPAGGGCPASTATTTVSIEARPAAPVLTPTQPTCTIATGTVTITGVAGLTYSFDGGAYSGTLVYGGLTAGSSHTVTAQNAAGCISLVSNIILNAIPAIPAVPTLTPTHPTCTTATGSVAITAVAGLTYSFDGFPYSGTLVYSGLAAGSSHTVTAQNATGCISPVANVTINAPVGAPAAPTLTPTHPTCTVATGTITITGVTGLTYSFDGGAYSGTLVYSGLVAGSSHTVTAQNAGGCTSAVTNITLNLQPAAPATPTLTPTHPTCTVATGTVTITGVAGLTYSFDGGTYSATLIYSGLAAGSTHTVTAQNASGCISPVANITLNAPIGAPAVPTLTATHPTCTVATGTVTITAVAGLTYSFDGGTYSGTLVYSGLAAGSSHTVTAQNAGGCTSVVANITLNAQPTTLAAPTLTPTHPTCTLATGSVTITGVAGLTYSFDGGAYSGTLIYNGLTAGSSHTVTAQDALGCISAPANITLNAQPATPTIPTLTVTHPTCTVSTGSIDITGVAGMTYSFDGGPYTTILNYSGLAAGSSHTLTVLNPAGCISPIANVTLNTPLGAPATPVLTVTQPTCTLATGTIDITPVIGLAYSFDGGPYAATLNFSGLAAGSTHTIMAQNAAGCLSPVASVTLNTQPTTPAAPTATTTHPTCALATGSIDITGVPGLTYSFDGGPFAATLTYSGLAAGSSHTITAQNAGCISAVTTVTLNAQPTTPTVPTVTPTHPTCTVATGSIAITGVAGMSYSFDGGPYTTTLNYSGLTAGSSHTVVVQNPAGCVSAAATVVINAQPASVLAPTLTPTHPTCTVATGSISITVVTGLTYSFDAGPYSTTATYSGLAAGSLHTVTAQNAAGCISPLVSITLNTQPLTPPVPTILLTQPTCSTPTGTLTITPDVGSTYSVDGGAYSATLIYSGMTVGVNHTINAINSDGCVSNTLNFTFNAAPGTPATPIVNIIHPTCTTPSGTCAVLTPLPGLLYSLDGAPYSSNTNYSGLGPGIHILTAQNPLGCISAPATIVINPQPTTPIAPFLALTQPTCSVATGSVSITGVLGLTYSIDGGLFSTTLNYTGIAVGSHQITAQNADGCTASSPFVINLQPATPAVPTLSITHPDCIVWSGGVTVMGLPGESYSLDGGPFLAPLIVNNLLPNTTHTVIAKNTAGCQSAPLTFTLNPRPPIPPIPTITLTHPDCNNATGSIAIIPDPDSTYSLDGITFSNTLTYSGFTPGMTYHLIALNSHGCLSSSTNFSFLPQPITPAAPVVSVTQPTCTNASGSVAITGVSGQTYSFDGGAYTSGLIYNGLIAGSSHTVTTKNATGCISAVANIMINAQPITPVATALGAQTICSGSTTAVTLSAIAGTTFSWTVTQTGVSGATTGSGNTIAQTLTTTGNTSGQVVYSITPVANGCIGLPVSFIVTVNPIPVAFANAAATTLCSGTSTNISLNGPVANTIFNWTVVQTGVSGAVAGSGNAIIQTLTATGIVQGTAVYSITPVKNGCSGIPVQITINVNPRPQVTNLTQFSICDGDSSNINLTANIVGTGYTWTIVENNVTGALAGTGSIINQPLSLTGSSVGTVVYTVTPTANSCSGSPFNITVKVHPLPKPSLTGGIICVEQSTGTTVKTYTLHSGLNNSDYHFEWTRDGNILTGNSNTYVADIAGDYSVIAINNITGCVSAEVFATVTAVFIGDRFTATVTNAFTENATIVATIPNGTGPFYYQLNNGPKQSSNVFTGVSGGTYTVLITDDYGCTDLTQEVTVIDYPKFFTPNGDGYNDYWNISGLDDPAKISIFDRYGKFIKQISTEGLGWDGTYNGAMLPSTDYWFTIDYRENKIDKIFKAHFSLKR